MLPPGEIFTAGNTQVLAAVYHFQCMFMDLIVGIHEVMFGSHNGFLILSKHHHRKMKINLYTMLTQ